MVFKWAVTTGREGREGTFWGLAWAGAAESEPPPSKRHSLAPLPCLVFGSLVFLLHSFSPSPSHPSLKESHIPYIPSLALQSQALSQASYTESLPQPRTLRNWEWGGGGWRRSRKLRGESTLPKGLTDIFRIQKLSSFSLIASVAVEGATVHGAWAVMVIV